jgi:hypothetical protein
VWNPGQNIHINVHTDRFSSPWKEMHCTTVSLHDNDEDVQEFIMASHWTASIHHNDPHKWQNQEMAWFNEKKQESLYRKL